MDLDGVIGGSVGQFGDVGLAQRGQNGRDLAVGFFFLLQLGGDGFGVLARFVGIVAQIHPFGGEIEQAAAGQDAGAVGHQHFIDGGELNNGFAELFTLLGVLEAAAPGGFGSAEGLSANGDAGAVHQAHDIAGEAAAAVADQLGGDVVEL